MKGAMMVKNPRKFDRYAVLRRGVEWIALNDGPAECDVEAVSRYTSTGLLSAILGFEREKVAVSIVRFRKDVERREE